MGLHFGELAKVYGRVQHTLSPFELNPLKGVFTLARLLNIARRIGDNAPYMAPRKIRNTISRSFVIQIVH